MANVYTRIGYIKGATGAAGAQGEKGDTGDAATIEVGSVTTVPYGQTANVVNSGTEQAAVFDFTIPQGRPGQQVTEMDNLLLNSITTSAAEFPLPAVGETGKVLWGKMVKWCSDMAALVATKFNAANVVNNLTTTSSGYALDARQGKELSDMIAVFSQSIMLTNAQEHRNINIDTINGENGYIIRTLSSAQTGTFPPSTAGNAGILIGFSSYSGSKLIYGSQIMLTFGGNGIYKRNANYSTSGSTWSAWTTF